MAAGMGGPKALDEAARLRIERLPGVAEACPDPRFMGEFPFADLTRHSLATALPESVKTTGDFNNVKGRFFSSPEAAEAMAEKSFAAELPGKPVPRPGRGMLKGLASASPGVPAPARDPIGKELAPNYSVMAFSIGAAKSAS
jgi:hypothetical protein